MHKTHINISCVISVVTNGTHWKLGNTYKFSLSYLVDTTVQPAAHVDRCSRRLLAQIVIINLSSTLKFVKGIYYFQRDSEAVFGINIVIWGFTICLLFRDPKIKF